MTPKRHLLTIKGITEAKVEKIGAACHKLSGRGMFASAQQCLLESQSKIFLIAGSIEFDKILGGSGFDKMSDFRSFYSATTNSKSTDLGSTTTSSRVQSQLHLGNVFNWMS